MTEVYVAGFEILCSTPKKVNVSTMVMEQLFLNLFVMQVITSQNKICLNEVQNKCLKFESYIKH